MKKNKLKRNSVFFFFILFGFWMSLAASFRLDEMVVGLASVILVMALTHHLFFRDEELPKRGGFQFINWIKLLLHLAVEIVNANIAVAKLVLNPTMKIQPHIFTHKTKLKSDVLKVLFANSITLTPGTLTIDIIGDELVIHALTNEAQQDLESGSLEAPFLKLEEKQ